MEIIDKYFPHLTATQRNLFAQLHDLYMHWNEQINVVSRQDIENLYERHVLHSLAIAKFITFKPHTSVIDVGTGGGFPGIPLAIFFPDVHFYLCDSIKRKTKVVSEIAAALQLKNVTVDTARSEQVNHKFDFVVSRAVSRLPKFVKLVQKNLHNHSKNDIQNGIIYLKGGDFEEELEEMHATEATIVELKDYFSEEFFETKKIVYLPYHLI